MTRGTWQIDQLWYNTSILRFRIFYCKKSKNKNFFPTSFASRTRHFEYISEYGRFPSTGPGSRVRVQVPKYGSPTSDLFRSRFPSTGPGSRVRVPEYGFWEKRQKNFKLHKMISIFNIDLKEWCWSICHLSWVIEIEPGPKKIGSSQRYEVKK